MHTHSGSLGNLACCTHAFVLATSSEITFVSHHPLWNFGIVTCWSEMTLNYWMMMERYPNLKEEVGSSIPCYEISSLLDRVLARWNCLLCFGAGLLAFYLKKIKNKKSLASMSIYPYLSTLKNPLYILFQ
jgi:hypothetical protein